MFSVDGGSSDATTAVAANHATVLSAPRGRASISPAEGEGFLLEVSGFNIGMPPTARFNIGMPRAQIAEAVERLQAAFADLQ